MSPVQSRYPLLGAHMSIAGGVSNAIAEGAAHNCNCLQIFTKASNQWKSKPYTEEEIAKFHAARQAAGINPVVAHTAYLINIASPKADIYKMSVAALIDELERCHLLGIEDIVMHPGSYLDSSVEEGIKRIVDTLNEIFDKTAAIKTRVALETTAGQGTNLGHKFEQIAQMIAGIENQNRISVCLDTCHIFAAGYDIRDKKSYQTTLEEFDKIIGLAYLKVIHLNDSQKEFGSKRDRHEHIGRGFIGEEAFRLIVQDKRLEEIPKLLETPKEEDGRDMDEVNLALLRKLYKAKPKQKKK